MRNSKARVAKQAYDSLGRMFVLESQFRLYAQHQMKEELRKTEPRLPLWLRWVFRLLVGGVTV